MNPTTDIISFEHGTMYLKLQETFDTSRMEIHTALAEITRESVTVVKADSKGEVSSTSMTLPMTQMAKIIAGVQMVERYWEREPLPHKHVLLDCGCIVNWDDWEDVYRREKSPHVAMETWCKDHEDVAVYRLNESDFTSTLVAQEAK